MADASVPPLEPSYSKLEFVRSAVKGRDPLEAVQGLGSLWQMPEASVPEGMEPLMWLSPAHVQQYGLVQKMRVGVQEEVENGPRSSEIEKAQAQRAGGNSEAPTAEVMDDIARYSDPGSVIEGSTKDWRWSLVEGTIALDNKPQVERTKEDVDPQKRAQLEHVRIPVPVLHAITKNLPT